MTYSFARSNVQVGAIRITAPNGDSRVIGTFLASEFLDLQSLYPKGSDEFNQACAKYFHLGTFIPEKRGNDANS